MPVSSEARVDQILELFETAGQSAYFGEPVTQLEHALECAQLARDAGGDEEMIIAALLHDIGHLLDDEGLRDDAVGVIDHDATGARYLRERGFSERVAQLVSGHVAAKRYLTLTNPSYFARLSPASVATLQLQGGPMTAEEAAAFGRDPWFEQKLRLRSWDEQGKLAGWAVAPLSSYRSLLVAHLNRGQN
jgi:2-amino-1-hydroxyethylphosphonate dioxygenase (glycine-forming)